MASEDYDLGRQDEVQLFTNDVPGSVRETSCIVDLRLYWSTVIVTGLLLVLPLIVKMFFSYTSGFLMRNITTV